MQTTALIFGILSLVGLFVGFFPCLGALNWINIPFSMVGLLISIIGLAQGTPGQRGGSIAGVVCCSIAVLFGLIRLIAGGGIL